MAEIKTKPTKESVAEFLNTVEPEQKKRDSLELKKIFDRVTRKRAVMWGNAMIGYGSYHYKSDRSSQEGDWPLTAFSPRKQSITLYIMPGFENYGELLENLGKHKTSVSCLYINKLADVDIKILEKLISVSVNDMKKRHGAK